MSDRELTPVKKVKKLEHAVLNSSPEKIARIYAELGEVELTARALAFAFRFRDVECVKVLVEGGAKLAVPFTNYMINTYGTYGDDFSVTLLEKYPERGIMLFTVVPTILNYPFKLENGTEPKPQPFEKRAETVRYLITHGEKAGFIAGELLFYAIIFEDEKMTAELKWLGVTLTEKRRRMLTDKGGQNDFLIWTSFLERSKTERFVPALSRLQRELGAKFHNTKGIYEAIFDKLYLPENLRFYLENFDKPTPNQTNILKLMIVKNSIVGLAFAESLGWLKQPKKRDELIEFASEHKSTECAAWLLDFKNRTADLAAERAEAEKKQERELNAAPGSVTVLKTLWNYKKREDGMIIINGYKGDRTEIEVPAKIGKSPVTAIKSEAFCPYHDRVITKNGRFLKTITSITLPESIAEIGKNAFDECCSLTSINIPNGVAEIPMSAFSRTAIESIVLPSGLKIIERYAFFECARLKSIAIPEGVTFIGFKAFAGCTELETVVLPGSLEEIEVGDTENKQIFSFDDKLTALVPRGSYAEDYCKKYNVHYKLKGER